jgi:hypothetical protein
MMNPRTTIYTFIAVTLGYLLISTLPLSITNLVNPTRDRLLESNGFNFSGLEDNTTTDSNNPGGTETTPQLKQRENDTEGLGIPEREESFDLSSYGFWILDLLIAIAIYLVAKRLLS